MADRPELSRLRGFKLRAMENLCELTGFSSKGWETLSNSHKSVSSRGNPVEITVFWPVYVTKPREREDTARAESGTRRRDRCCIAYIETSIDQGATPPLSGKYYLHVRLQD